MTSPLAKFDVSQLTVEERDAYRMSVSLAKAVTQKARENNEDARMGPLMAIELILALRKLYLSKSDEVMIAANERHEGIAK